ncbi:MAG: outer membrane beta-barrel protein [Chitinophagaceae bacterium]|nr:outer membrane beta-barrel protein [Chitinophagaceae bacterium]
MRKLITMLVLLTAGFISQAQIGKAKITGTVVDGNTKTIESATITLLRQTDSAVVKMSVADKTGKYVFENIPDGKYLVSITAVGHSKGFSEVIEVTGETSVVNVKTVELVPVGKNLAGVTVSSRKPLVEQKIDRTIVNVEAAASNVGATALEVLEKSPGVTVDKDGNISLKGKQGVQVYIDGRPSYLSGTDLANYLRNMNASQLESLEIMTTPPAKYDAAGNSGIINIKTKKTKQVGYSGSLSSNYSQGFYPKFNESGNFNYRKNKINLFANFGYSNRKNFNQLNIQRKFIEPVTKLLISHFDQYGRFIEGGNSVNGKIGMDYFASKKTTLGMAVNGFRNNGYFNSNGEVFITDPDMNPVSKTHSVAGNERIWKHLGANLNFRHVFDSAGQELTMDADYLSYNSSHQQSLFNYYYKANGGNSPKPDSLYGNLPQNIKIYSAKVDYTLPLAKNAKFEAGLKTSFVKTDNDAQYDSLNYGVRIMDIGRSNHFIYDENINAGYVNYTRPLNKKLQHSWVLDLRIPVRKVT